MSNDYAAIVSSVIVAILVVGFVELHDLKKRAREQVLADESQNLPRLQVVFDRLRAGHQLTEAELQTAIAVREERRAMGATFVFQWWLSTAWTFLCGVLISALGLTLLWAAIDGHGPARWLAWYTLLCTGLGILVVLIGAVMKGAAESRAMRRALQSQWDSFDSEFETLYRQINEYEQRRDTEAG
ncbi:hypothetical protein [Streptomyces misionensis]|uniref:hypothetical protein n=1 Tax=Streptomyces misionensis TaxID=67331 RepID=UPI0033E841FE